MCPCLHSKFSVHFSVRNSLSYIKIGERVNIDFIFNNSEVYRTHLKAHPKVENLGSHCDFCNNCTLL